MRYKIEKFPKISVVTPSFNQADYLGETLASVFDQRYPNLEYIVIDGGSTDGSVELIQAHAERLAYWVSEKDEGQSQAINKGFAKATGDVICWLNSDDVFLPGALNAVAYYFNANPDWEWVSGSSVKYGEGLHELTGFFEQPKSRAEWLVHCPIIQPSTFWRRSLYEKFGGVDESFHFALDYEYWVRFVTGGVQMHFIDRPLSGYRLHDVSKTVAQSEKFLTEESRLREKHIGKLTSTEQSELRRLLSKSASVDELVRSVVLLNEGKVDEARASVISVLKSSPGLLFTRTGAASLFRVMTNKPRYKS